MDNLSGFEGLLREWILEEGMKPDSLSEMEQNIRESMKELGSNYGWSWSQVLIQDQSGTVSNVRKKRGMNVIAKPVYEACLVK